jgi:hypothetical protein
MICFIGAKKSKTKASGAGTTRIFTKIAQKQTLQMGSWKNIALSVIFTICRMLMKLCTTQAKPVHESLALMF